MLDTEGLRRINFCCQDTSRRLSSIRTPFPRDHLEAGTTQAQGLRSPSPLRNQEKQGNYTLASAACKPKLYPPGLGLGSGQGSNQELQSLPGETLK